MSARVGDEDGQAALLARAAYAAATAMHQESLDSDSVTVSVDAEQAPRAAPQPSVLHRAAAVLTQRRAPGSALIVAYR